ncbi:pilus assembly protein PilP [Candidatus Electrothrix sp.]
MRRYFVTILMLFLVMLLLDSSSWATESDIIGEGGQAGLEESVREVDKFNYQFGDRPDPFLPFLSKDNSRDELDDTPINEGSGEPLTGMQLFEPGQLKLVAVFKIGNRNIAMAEDVTGKGYRLDENMPIGRYGTINRIGDEQVEITETYKTTTGRVVTKEIVMRLKKEGDN